MRKINIMMLGLILLGVLSLGCISEETTKTPTSPQPQKTVAPQTPAPTKQTYAPPTTPPPSKKRFLVHFKGENSELHFTRLPQQIQNEGYIVTAVPGGARLTNYNLKDYDALVIVEENEQSGTRTYSSDEIDAIFNLVKNGGGLWLLAFHCDYSCGIDFQQVIFPELGIDFYKPGRNFNSYSFKVFPHPITNGVRLMDTSSSRTFSVKPPGKIVLEFEGYPVMIATTYGRGRVVADSLNSAFNSGPLYGERMPEADHYELFKNILSWVSSSSPSTPAGASSYAPTP